MSLRTRIVWYLSVVVLVWAGIHHVVQKVFVMREFTKLEEEEARRNIKRVKNVIEREKELLGQLCTNWASSDQTYRWMLERDPRLPKESFDAEVFRRNRLNLLYVCDMRGKVLWGRCVDSKGKPMTLADFPANDLGEKHPLVMSKVTYVDTGLWLTDGGAMLVSAKSITDSRGNGPVRGTVIVGRMLRDKSADAGDYEQYMRDLELQTEVTFEVWGIDATTDGKDGAQKGMDCPMLASEQVTMDEILEAEQPVVRVRDDEQLRAFSTLDDVRGEPALVVCATVPRNVTSQGERAVVSALISTVAAGALFLLVLLRLLQQNVLGPIAKLTQHAVEIGKSEDPTKKLDLARTDELGVLAQELDGMMEKLAQSRAALVKAARHAGMSEIATGVLHNVGNVLNSVNVSATLVAEKTRSSGVADLKMAMDAVRDSAGDLAAFLAKDPRGTHLSPLLMALTEQIAGEQSALEDEVKRLTDGIDHIKLLIQSQQSYAGHSGVLEVTALSEQVEAAISMTARTVGDDPLEIVREYEQLPAFKVDRHRLIEILVNLVQNARQSLQAPDLALRRLTVRVKAVDEDRVAIEVEDTGVGIPTENLERVFVHGFTTKKNGHGFGLHASANAATEMGGKLVAHSDGPGKGACFRLEIPVKSRATAGASA